MTRRTALDRLALDRLASAMRAAWLGVGCGLVLLLAGVPGAVADETAEDRSAETATVTKTLKWTTASEVDNFGYDVYRGASEDGPFERRTEDPVLGAGTTDEPTSYRYVDDGLVPGRDYYYYVESISIHGERERFTPIIRVTAKRAEDESSSAEESAAESAPGGDG